MLRLAQAIQTVKSVLNEQSDQLSQLAQSAQTTRATLGEHSEQLAQLTSTELDYATQSQHNEQAELLRLLGDSIQLARLTLASQSDRLDQLTSEQAEQLKVLSQLSEHAQANPLGIQVDDVEAYIRQIARSKE
jgi:hypothetical protein